MPGSAQAQSDRTAGSAPSSSGRSRRISGDASSSSTQPRRWRSANAVVPEMMIAVHHKGTEGSNPSPSRKESAANLSPQLGSNTIALLPGMTVCMIRPVAEAAVTFADWGSYGRAMQSITADPDYQRLMAELTKTFEIVDRSIVIGEEV